MTYCPKPRSSFKDRADFAYTHARDVYRAHESRYDKIEEKSARFFGIMGIVVGGSLFGVPSFVLAVVPPRSPLDVLILLFGLGLLVFLFVALYSVLSLFAIRDLPSEPLNDKLLHAIEHEHLPDLKRRLASRYKNAKVETEQINRTKIEQYKMADRIWRRIVLPCLAVFIALVLTREGWVRSTHHRSANMSEESHDDATDFERQKRDVDQDDGRVETKGPPDTTNK